MKNPSVIMHNGEEFINAVEAAKRMDVSLRTLVRRVQTGMLTPYRIPGFSNGPGLKSPHYFKADQVRKFMS